MTRFEALDLNIAKFMTVEIIQGQTRSNIRQNNRLRKRTCLRLKQSLARFPSTFTQSESVIQWIRSHLICQQASFLFAWAYLSLICLTSSGAGIWRYGFSSNIFRYSSKVLPEFDIFFPVFLNFENLVINRLWNFLSKSSTEKTNCVCFTTTFDMNNPRNSLIF